MNKFTVKCESCGNCDQREIQTTMEDWDGYSEYTVLEDGFIEFKCKKCGTFGSSHPEKKEGNNKIDLFKIRCNQCGGTKCEFEDSLNSGSMNITCEKCGCQEFFDR